MAGWVRLRGTLQVRPCKLGRAIHGAHAPATGPTPPSTDSYDLSEPRSVLLLVGGTGTAWGQIRFPQENGSDPRTISISDRDSSTHGVDLLQIAEIRRRWGGVGLRGVSRMGPRHASGGLGRTPNPGLAVCAGKRTRASRGQAYREVLAASPQSDTAPPSHGMPAVAVAVASASAGAGRSPAEPSTPLLLLPGAARAWCPVAARRSAST
ncbi:hypothetical protein SAMN05720615_104102 [Stenotrophomonas indicatrix]|nr:hypothetical protein SAMN05720615_104102 [Stenotrophomonas indicatrix]